VADLKKADALALEKEAEELLERVAKDKAYADTMIPFGDDTIKLGKLARRKLFEMRYLQPGKVAPDIVGVNSDTDRAKAKELSAKKGPPWPSFWDGGSTNGTIQNQWNIQSYPTMYLIDHKGVIIGQTYPIGEGAALIERTVKEAESAVSM
jgi:hypothetical protein